MTNGIVAMDGREFLPGRQTGIGRCLTALIDHVRRQPPAWNLEVVGPPGFLPPDGVPSHTLAARDGWLWDLVHLPRYLRQVEARAYLTPYVKFRPTAGCPVVLVICDPTDLLPEASSRGALVERLLRAVRLTLARRAAARITISGWSRNEIARILHLPPESVRVVAPGIALRPAPLRASGETGYVLHLSNGRPHKNIPALLDAYAALPPSLQAAHPLLLAGIHAERREAIERAISAHDFVGAVRVEGHVDESRLPVLYSGAAVFAFPSLVEGFGIPALEAMACGVPVVASTAGALPEVLGDAAILVDPRDPGALREALAGVLTDGALRERLVRRGLARAAQFPLEQTGAALADVVNEVFGRSSR